MYQSKTFHSGPITSTPMIIKWTIILTCIINFFALISNALFTQVLGLSSPQYFLTLTTWGIHKFFLWQFVSHFFIQPIAQEGISFSIVLQMFFCIYLLWSIGSAIVQARGTKHFVGLYFVGGCFVGIIAYVLLLLSGSLLPFSGATSCLYILLIGWVFLFPETRVSLFFLLSMQAKWLIFSLIGIHLFLDFANGNFLMFSINTSATLYAYLYAILALEMLSPFHQLHKIEKTLIYFKRKATNIFFQSIATRTHSSKIQPITKKRTTLFDEAFMDKCLEKISTAGHHSLSFRERFRMWRISKKKKM